MDSIYCSIEFPYNITQMKMHALMYSVVMSKHPITLVSMQHSGSPLKGHLCIKDTSLYLDLLHYSWNEGTWVRHQVPKVSTIEGFHCTSLQSCNISPHYVHGSMGSIMSISGIYGLVPGLSRV